MCLRHTFDLYLAAFGSLLDLTGKQYLRASRRILNRVRRCPKCLAKAERNL